MDDYDYFEGEEQYADGETYEDEEEGNAQEDKHKPTPEELEYLEFRQRMKEQIRRRRNEMGSKSLVTKSRPPDNFGSFFGPSQPVIAQRVIQESKPLLENPQIADRVFNSSRSQANNKKEKTHSTPKKITETIPKAKKEVQKKVQQLKNTRDYSFLFSENAPTPSKQPKSSSINRPNRPSTDVQVNRSTPVSQKNKQSLLTPRTQMHQPPKERNLNTGISQKPGPSKATSSYKPFSSMTNDRNPKSGPAKDHIPPTKPTHRNIGAPLHQASKPGTSLGSSKPVPPSGQLSTQKSQSSKPPATTGESKKPSQNGKVNETTRQPMLKPNNGSKPHRQLPSHAADHRPKKLARGFGEDEDARALQEIRKMFNTRRYAGVSDDDSDMEANFDEIMREERISSKIARKEDEEQIRLIEEEERRERARKIAKKRKIRD